MEVPESTQRHTHVRLKQIELTLLTLWDGRFVFCHVTTEISAQVMVRCRITRSVCRICPVVGIGLPVGSILVVSSTYEPQHYKTNKMTCAPSEDSNQPGHPPSLIRIFAVRTIGSWGPNVSSCGQRRLWPDWADVQADLRLRWAQRPFCWFGRTASHIKVSHAVKRP